MTYPQAAVSSTSAALEDCGQMGRRLRVGARSRGLDGYLVSSEHAAS
jgi:hypothetical protein